MGSVLFSGIAILLFLILLYLVVLVRPAGTRLPPSLLTHYAHRGLHDPDIPENSLAAFRKAVEHGYGIELDLQLSADGEVMVFHDYTLERMTGASGKLSAYTAADLASMHLLSRRGLRTEETIPTLREVLALVDGAVPLLIELKGESLNTAVCAAADPILRSYHGEYCVESFNPLLLRWYKTNHREVFRGQLYTDVWCEKGKTLLNLLLSGMVFNALARPHFIAYDRRYADRLPVTLTTKLYGADHFLWTIRSEEERGGSGECMIFENITP